MRTPTDIVGYLLQMNYKTTSPKFETNGHVAFTSIRIPEKFRGNGLGLEALDFLKVRGKQKGCRILELFTSNEPAKKFAEKLGLPILHKHYVNRLLMKDIDWDKMQEWIENGKQKATGVILELFINRIPEKDLKQYTELYTETENQAPWGSETEQKVTPESQRVNEKNLADRGKTLIVFCSREPNGELSGITEIVYDPLNPEEISQELTGVRDKYRGRGLGKWLKAQMAFYIKKNYPKARYISTGNAVDNKPMLAINNQMGFRETNVFHLYQINCE